MSDVSVMLAAQSVAMRAMVNDLDQHAVDDMRTRAEELACSQTLFRAITSFVTQYELARFDRDALRAEGEALRDAVVQASAVPASHAPALPERRDIDG